LLAFSGIGLVVLMFAADHFKLHTKLPLDNPPEVLTSRAREVVRQLGYNEPYADEAFAFELDTGFLNYIQDHDKSPGRWQSLAAGRPATLVFWYRQSPKLMQAQRFFSSPQR